MKKKINNSSKIEVKKSVYSGKNCKIYHKRYQGKSIVEVVYIGKNFTNEDLEWLHGIVICQGCKTICLKCTEISFNDSTFQVFIDSILYDFEEVYKVGSDEKMTRIDNTSKN